MTTAAPRWYAHPYNRPLFYRLAGAAAMLPRPARLCLAMGVAEVAARWMPAERAVVRRNLERITGAQGAALDALARALFRDFAVCFADLVSTNRRRGRALQGRIARVIGAEYMRGMEGGVISLTAHLGNWELAGRLLASRARRATHVVVAPDEAPGLDRWLRRNGDGVRFVTRARATAAVNLLAALRRGEVVALQGDRALGGRSDVNVSFFGRAAPFPLGPFLLGRASGAPILPAFCVLDADRRYVVMLGEPFTVPPGGEEGALIRWVGLLEQAVRERPTQWFNFYDVWTPFDA